jgi:hypothetical protein
MVDDQDQIKTQLITKIRWMAPVASAELLPTEDVQEGAHCFVEGVEGDAEEEIWMYAEGQWTRIDEL